MAESQANGHGVLSANDSAVIKTLEMYQAIITRMATNSAACKNWCTPLITAILIFAVKENKPQLIGLTLIPLLICYLLDAYYLMLENRFRAGFQLAATKVADSSFGYDDLFKLMPTGSKSGLWRKALFSLATWPVYSGLLLLIGLGYKIAGGC
ncbi:hypothetical protein ACH50O_07900 [Methylomonas sp. 2BW1-5-20]|uniref:hypothetical protein n=1 Tax=Methylomonas sp. 2BW1-5-20 TaxID=3376686 RepID=UPI004052A8EF